MKKVLAYSAVFLLGTMASGTVAWAATKYVQAQTNRSTIVVNGQTVASPDSLVYNSTYVQLWAFEQGLKKMGMNPTWDGRTFLFNVPMAMSPSDFLKNADNVSSLMQSIASDVGAINPQSSTQNDFVKVDGYIQLLQQEHKAVSQWVVSKPTQMAVKSDLLQFISDEIATLTFMRAAIADNLDGDPVDAQKNIDAADQFTQLVAWPMYTQLNNDMKADLSS